MGMMANTAKTDQTTLHIVQPSKGLSSMCGHHYKTYPHRHAT